MKTVFTSHEIAHVWANKSAPHGKSPGAVSFDGPVIRSYATAIARHIEHRGKAAIILNVTSYSVTTSGHQSRIRQAIHDHGVPVFRVSDQRRGADLRFTGEELFAHYIQQAQQAEEDSRRPRIRPHTVEARKARAASFLEQAREVAAFYGLRRKVDEKAIQRLATAKARAEKREAIARAKREEAERQRQQENYDAWIAGTESACLFNARLFPVAFRIEKALDGYGSRTQDDELVSTLGARIPLDAARKAVRFAKLMRERGWHRNGERFEVGMYQLDAINPQGVVAGCHRVTWAEVERVEAMLNAALQPV